jgi:hypothetical protein
MPKIITDAEPSKNGHVAKPSIVSALPPSRKINAAAQKRVKIVSRAVAIAPPCLGEDAYLGHVGEFLRGVSDYTEATDAAILAHTLPAIGTYIGPNPFVYAGNRQPARVNFVVVGETNSGRKGTAFAPTDELMNELDADFWRAQCVGGLSSGEGLIVKVADKDGKPVEKRLLVLEEEFAKVLANTRREGNVLSPVIRQAFDNGNLATLTVKARNAYGAHVSIVAHITPEELDRRFDGVEAANGFGNRFLWFYVASDKLISRPKPIPKEVFCKFAEQLRNVANFPERRIEFDRAAADLWDSVYRKLRTDRPGIVGAITARGPAIVLRLALIYAIVELPKAPKIRVEHLKAALAVWQYNVKSAELVFDSKTGDRLGDRLLHMLQTHGPMTQKQFHRHLSNEQKRSLSPLLERMERDGLILSEELPPTKGRPATVWKIVEGLR